MSQINPFSLNGLLLVFLTQRKETKLGQGLTHLLSLNRIRWLCSKMAMRALGSYSAGLRKARPSGSPCTASSPGSLSSLSYGKGTTLALPIASPVKKQTVKLRVLAGAWLDTLGARQCEVTPPWRGTLGPSLLQTWYKMNTSL